MEYSPSAFLSADRDSSNPSTADLIILNQPLQDFETFRRIWSHTRYRICADGGANRLYQLFSASLEKHRTEFLPNLIHGDLDSLSPSVSSFYSSQGVKISKDEDQYSTDFGKCMKIITNGYPPNSSYEKPSPQPGSSITTDSPSADAGYHDIVILSTLAGRVDQGIGLLHELHRESRREAQPSVRLWLLSEQSLSFLLLPGKSTIKSLSSTTGIFTKNIGILPIYGKAVISTKGLEWDVQDWETEMGGMVSTSNHVLGDEVVVVTDRIVLFTVERVRRDGGG
ncbi:thiamine pyrophosphokinase [Venturia nashicola]|uniref:Thiamine pyrophosphokinase n=1 Tax=Venturia nashicola TaxID=86259 RepID=A0A4Z1PFB6_9PEZI|nr:thiamine pyrophosphokinase [Venturia nashicola]TLD39436.1 thiamine pyrophosphokinase [Venturia nashicola]